MRVVLFLENFKFNLKGIIHDIQVDTVIRKDDIRVLSKNTKNVKTLSPFYLQVEIDISSHVL